MNNKDVLQALENAKQLVDDDIRFHEKYSTERHLELMRDICASFKAVVRHLKKQLPDSKGQ